MKPPTASRNVELSPQFSRIAMSPVRVNAGEAGVDERGVDRRLAAVEVDDAEDVHLQADDGGVLVGEERAAAGRG